MRLAFVIAAATALSACANPGGNYQGQELATRDPLEPINRPIYRFSDTVDRYTLKPIAKGYKAVTPEVVRRGVTNFSQNLFAPRSVVSNLLQGKPGGAASELFRFVVNSTIGIGGLIDVAGAGGIERQDETLSQTFAVWGLPEGPYVYVPFLGPHTLLDALARPVDMLSDPLYYYDDTSVRDKLYVLRIIDLRMRLLSIEGLLEDSQDKYVTIRESYLQNRRYEIYDGNPPQQEDEFFDEFFEEDAASGEGPAGEGAQAR